MAYEGADQNACRHKPASVICGLLSRDKQKQEMLGKPPSLVAFRFARRSPPKKVTTMPEERGILFEDTWKQKRCTIEKDPV
jgi:hypothetical protein